MKISRKILVALATLATLPCSAQSFCGWWSTKVAGIPISIHLDGPDRFLTGHLYSPTQTSDSILINKIVATGDSIRLKSKALKARFEGALISPDSICGIFSQGGASFDVILIKSPEALEVVKRPQTPMAPFQYFTEEVKVKSDDVILAGTLTMPVTRKPAGAVVFITGSGTQDRDETIMGHKPFAVLADWLTRCGWITLRCDDRGAGASTKGPGNPTYKDLTADVIAQIHYLESLPELQDKPIGVIGHSQGGSIAFMAAAEHPAEVQFIIALATPGVKGSELMVRQNEMIAGHFMSPAMAANLAELFGLVGSEKTSEEIKARVRELSSTLAPSSKVDEMVTMLLSEPYRELVSHDPQPYMRRVKCPVLAINGDNDMQVDALQNLPAIAAAIPHSVVKEYPNINHLMQPCDEPTLMYSEIDTTIDNQVLKEIHSFLLTK